MGRPRSKKATSEDKNALRQQEKLGNFNFWTHEILSRNFFKEFRTLGCQESVEKFIIAREVLLLSIYYHKNNMNDSFENFLHLDLNEDNIENYQYKYVNILHCIEKNIDKFEFEIRSIMDTVLNLTYKCPKLRLENYIKCDDFYIDNIKNYIDTLLKTCIIYGLYPHQLEFTNSEDLICNFIDDEDKLTSNQIFFINKHSSLPPVIFNHSTIDNCFFEKEQANKYYYYWNLYEHKSKKEILSDIEKILSCSLEDSRTNNYKRPENNFHHFVQICIDKSHKKYNYSKCIKHIELEIDSSILYYRKIFSYLHLSKVNADGSLNNKWENIASNKYLQEEWSRQIKNEHNYALVSLVCAGGYKAKHNNNSRLCGMYIWDLENIYGIHHTLTEAFLANDTKQVDENRKKLFELELTLQPNDPRENIEHIKEKLTKSGCNMTRVSIHQMYTQFDSLIKNCLEHPLWKR